MNEEDLRRARQLSRPSNLDAGRTAQSWYRIRNAADDETEVFVYDMIGDWGVTADDFVRDLAAITTPKIRLRVNSPGGDVFDGLAIYNSLAAHPATVTAQVDGLAASAASFIVCAADSTEMHRNAQMMIHDARGICIGNAADMQEMLDLLNMASDNIADIYAQKAGGETADWRETMRGEKWYSAQEAADAGLVDAVLAKPGKESGDEPAPKEDPEEENLEDLLSGVDLAAIMANAFSEELVQ